MGRAGAAAALASGAAYAAILAYYRPDYAGHFLAGFGGTLLLLAVLGAHGPRAVPIVVAIAILMGAGTEATIFRVALWDPVDFCHQSIGAVLAGAVALDRPRSRAAGALVGFVALFAGFVYAFS